MATNEQGMKDRLGLEKFEFELPTDPEDEGLEPDEDVQAVVTRLIEEAIQHYEENLEPDQVMATDYYYGRPFGDEKDGRSQVVSTEVRDATLNQMASLMKVFAGQERVVEFAPDNAQDKAEAERQTKYVNYVFMEDNPGYLVLDSVFKDALVRRIGILKWWWEEDPTPEGASLTGLSEAQAMGLLQDPEVESAEITSVDQAGFYSADVIWTQTGRVRVGAVPNEEFIFTPDATDLDSAGVVAHVREVPASELIAMGIAEEMVMEYAGTHLKSKGSDDLSDARQFHGGSGAVSSVEENTAQDKSQMPVVFAEAYGRVDVDGDGLSELRKFECIGPQFKIINGTDEEPGELADDAPFAVFTPVLEPHTIVGLSNFDLLRDIQKIISQVERGTLNSLAKAIDPPLEVVNNEVNMRDVLNPEISGVIRVRRPGMMREVTTQFIGPQSLPILDYYKDKRADRIGMTRAGEGLDPDSLQSSTQEAVGATLSRSQQMQEMIARTFAETGMKRAFVGIYKLIVEHQDYAREVEIDEQFVEFDPRSWTALRRVRVGVALGSGTTQERMAALEKIALKQSELKAQGSPLVTTVHERALLRRWTDLSGFKDTDEFFAPWGPQEEQQMQQAMAQQPPKKSPEEMLIEVEQMKVQMQAQMDQQKMQLERWKVSMEDDRARDKQAKDSVLKEREIELKHQAEINDAELKAQVARDRAEMDADVVLLTTQRDQAAAPPAPNPAAAPPAPNQEAALPAPNQEA